MAAAEPAAGQVGAVQAGTDRQTFAGRSLKGTLLAMLDSFPSDPDAPPIVRAGDVAALVAADQGLSGVLEAFPDLTAPRLAASVTGLAAVADSAVPGVFGGDVLYFAAKGTDRPADLWRPFVSGGIEVHSVDHVHDDMTRPDALAQIGPVLAARLAQGPGPRPPR